MLLVWEWILNELSGDITLIFPRMKREKDRGEKKGGRLNDGVVDKIGIGVGHLCSALFLRLHGGSLVGLPGPSAFIPMHNFLFYAPMVMIT